MWCVLCIEIAQHPIDRHLAALQCGSDVEEVLKMWLYKCRGPLGPSLHLSLSLVFWEDNTQSIVSRLR